MQRHANLVAILFLLIMSSPASASPTSHIVLDNGNVFVARVPGQRLEVLAGSVDELVLSPDGRFAVAIRIERTDRKSIDNDEMSAVYLIDSLTAKAERLVIPHTSSDLKQTLGRSRHPAFSLDGKSVFFAVDAWATSNAIHRIDLTDRSLHFVIDGNSNDVILKGPWRGSLLVWRHLYRHGAAVDLAQVVSPHGRVLTSVPGSDGPNGVAIVEQWLRSQGRRPR